MKKHIAVIFLFCAGCASYDLKRYDPVVDQSSPQFNRDRYADDLMACRAYTSQVPHEWPNVVVRRCLIGRGYSVLTHKSVI